MEQLDRSVWKSVQTFKYSLTRWNGTHLDKTGHSGQGLRHDDFPVQFTNTQFGFYVASVEGVSSENATVIRATFGLDLNYTDVEIPAIPGTCVDDSLPEWLVIGNDGSTGQFSLPNPTCTVPAGTKDSNTSVGNGYSGAGNTRPYDSIRIRFTDPDTNRSVTVVVPISNRSVPIPAEFVPGRVSIDFQYVNSSSAGNVTSPWSPPYVITTTNSVTGESIHIKLIT